jgi:hypothetical protein
MTEQRGGKRVLSRLWSWIRQPFRPRPPMEDWTKDLLTPHERQSLDAQSAHIARTIERLQIEIAMIARDHRKG